MRNRKDHYFGILAIIACLPLLVVGLMGCGSDTPPSQPTEGAFYGSDFAKKANEICQASEHGVRTYSVGTGYDMVVCDDGVVHQIVERR